MFKKLISLICCLLPVGAGAAVVPFDEGDWDITLGVGVIDATSSKWQQAMKTDGNSIRINKGNSINDVLINATDYGVNFANGMYVGQEEVPDSDLIQNNALYIMAGANTDKLFAIDTVRNVSIGTILSVLDGWTLNVRGANNASGDIVGNFLVGDTDNPANVYVTSGAKLNVSNLQSIQINGGVRADGDVNLAANEINVGIVNVNSGGTINVGALDGNVSMTALNAFDGAGTSDIKSSGDITIAQDVQKSANTGNMSIQAGGDVTIGGNLENSGGLLTVDAKDINVSGSIQNDGNNSGLSLVAENLTVSGASSFSRGNFDATISGKTTFSNGISVNANSGADNVFSLTTGTVDFGANKALLNSLSSFTLNVTDEDSGDLSATAVENSGANMILDIERQLSASYLSALKGNLSVNAANVVLNSAADASVQNAINVNDGASLSVIASGTVSATGVVSNRGNTTINAATVSLGNISNNGENAVMKVGSSTSPIGTITIAGDIANNNGNFTLHAKNVSVNGLLDVTNQGVTNIIGSDSGDGTPIQFGGIDVDNATLNLKVLAGGVNVTGDMTVADAGVVNLDSSVTKIDVGGDFSLIGTLDIGSSIFALSAAKIDLQNGWNLESPSKTVRFISDNIDITGDVSVAQGSNLILQDTDNGDLTVSGNVGGVDSVGTIAIYSDTATVGSLNHNGLILAYGDGIVATNGDINVAGALRSDNQNADEAGLSLMSDSFVLRTNNGNILLNDVQIAVDKNLTLDSVGDLTVGALNNQGTVSAIAQTVNANGLTQNRGVFSVDAGTIKLKDVENYAGAGIDLLAKQSVSVTGVTNSGLMNIAYTDQNSAVTNVTVNGNILNQTGGMLNVSFDTLSVKDITVNGGTVNLNASGMALVSADNVGVTGDIVQGAQTGALNLVGVNLFSAKNMTTGGNFNVVAGDGLYKLSKLDISGDLSVYADATAEYDISGAFNAENIINNGHTEIVADGGIKIANKISNNDGNMFLESVGNYIYADSFDVADGQVALSGAGLDIANALTVDGVLGQGDSFAMMNIVPDTYTINAGTFNVGGINQTGKLNINSSDITVAGNIVATDLTISASPSTNWMNVFVDGDVSGGVDFIGLEKMQITGDYLFDGNSSLMAAILPYADGTGLNTTDINYWASVNLSGGKLGQVTNAPDAKPLIAVGGKFSSDLTMDGLGSAENEYLEDSQVGIKIFDMIDQGTAIWLLHADGGVSDISTKIRNINVKFCNEDGSTCVAYFNDLNPESDGLPAYISVRDSDNDGETDSLYVVFDERFGGPVALFPIQPIVADVPMHKDSEYLAAGAIDSMIAGQLQANKFYNKTPLEVLPVIFQGTNMELSMKELYNRMEDYVIYYDGNTLSSFSRLFEGADGEQAAGLMALNEHTTFRSFEDRMVDEFIWNRNRRLDKAWLDVDYGMFYQNTLSVNHTDGNRFAISGGFDWQESDTLILGLAGHVSHSASAAGDVFDLSYTNVSQMGHLDTNVTDTNVGLGGYLMKTLGDKARLYGNAFVDAHLFDVERNQTFVDTIDGDGTAFSLISEFGLLHDILNQYIVGNVYARVGYNFGLDISSDAAGSEFMKYKQDGYFMLTPGYSLTAQKRIYPSAWFQIRPYATIGIEYDVLGMKDSIEYKFAGATNYSPYDINIEPLWANIGGGFEMLSANGLQFGLDYRYQYNQEMQLHNIRFTGMYRF